MPVDGLPIDSLSPRGHAEMGLAPCRECQAQVSTEALSCPHCGVPNPTPAPVSPPLRPSPKAAKKGLRPVQLGCLVIFVGGALLFIIALIFGPRGQSPSDRGQASGPVPPPTASSAPSSRIFGVALATAPPSPEHQAVYKECVQATWSADWYTSRRLLQTSPGREGTNADELAVETIITQMKDPAVWQFLACMNRRAQKLNLPARFYEALESHFTKLRAADPMWIEIACGLDSYPGGKRSRELLTYAECKEFYGDVGAAIDIRCEATSNDDTSEAECKHNGYVKRYVTDRTYRDKLTGIAKVLQKKQGGLSGEDAAQEECRVGTGDRIPDLWKCLLSKGYPKYIETYEALTKQASGKSSETGAPRQAEQPAPKADKSDALFAAIADCQAIVSRSVATARFVDYDAYYQAWMNELNTCIRAKIGSSPPVWALKGDPRLTKIAEDNWAAAKGYK